MSTPSPQFVCFAHQDLDRKAIKKYAKQYDGVDMIALMGLREGDIPFLIRLDDDYGLMYWSESLGMMMQIDEDDVRAYATKQYLIQKQCRIFDSAVDAVAITQTWSKKQVSVSEDGSNNPSA
jgi:aromatic ring-opening dioxygenase LigB subunit